ncbi:FHA domain-containing protein (plasmid) [Leifsonia sp. ZF2019]|uniref:FHA domain-containing protein n=1 Tax=Leifsonia sp. ZF2019 TaxID=2781978 RepID=UPI001CBAED71|nr:FHA domain-containing protein [Leifsonia sp. ZF2019]UAJ81707.1 FHA domain-containing protein [Leifsonia sp. ZF2019]
MTQIYATTERDGSAIMTIDGSRRKVIGEDLDDARRKVLGIVREHAATTDTVAAFTSNDPDGTWSMLVHPDGHVQENGRHDTATSMPATDDLADLFDTRDVAPAAVDDSEAAPTFVAPVLLKPPVVAPTLPVLRTLPEPTTDTVDGPGEEDPFFELERTMIRPRKTPPRGPELRLSSGLTITLEETVVIGRRPHALAEDGSARQMSIDSDREMSRTHAVFGRTSMGEVWVLDCGSSNGTWVLDANGQRVAELEPQIRYRLRPSDVLEIGNVQITLHPDPAADDLRDLPTHNPINEMSSR